MKLAALVGSGRKIGILAGPFLVVGLVLNVLWPSLFSVGGPPLALLVVSVVIILPGILVWAWSVYLILTRIPRRELITVGPYALVKHPLYTGVALLVLPWVGFIFDSWLGLLAGLLVYLGSRLYSPEEERVLAKLFGPAWDEYCARVRLPWL